MQERAEEYLKDEQDYLDVEYKIDISKNVLLHNETASSELTNANGLISITCDQCKETY
jgi:hypothetical protein